MPRNAHLVFAGHPARRRLEGFRKSSATPARNLVEFFGNSPFAGLNMDFERDRDIGREVKL